MTVAERLAALTPSARAAALAVLDEISRPMTVREIDHAFAQAGVPRSVRRPAIRALAHVDVIAVAPR